MQHGSGKMVDTQSHPVIKAILHRMPALTPKGRVLGDFILKNPRKAIFMTTKELSASCGVSEATVVRFVGQIGYSGYGSFLQALRDFVDTGMSLPERMDLQAPDGDRLHRMLLEEMNNLRQLYEALDVAALSAIIEHLEKRPFIYVAGSRISYTFAYHLGWSLTKLRKGVTILRGSDSTAIDWLTNAPADSAVVLFAASRYPNELIRLGKVARRLEHTLLVISDSALCPIIPFAHHCLVAPSKSIPLIGYTTAILCIINYIILELSARRNEKQSLHQQRLEQVYRENDILFDMYTDGFGQP